MTREAELAARVEALENELEGVAGVLDGIRLALDRLGYREPPARPRLRVVDPGE